MAGRAPTFLYTSDPYICLFRRLAMLWLLLVESMILDGGTAVGAGLLSVSAQANGTSMRVSGRYEAGGMVPVLVWPGAGGGVWGNPCRSASDLCCMREVVSLYRHDALAAAVRALPPSACPRELRGDLVAGSLQGMQAGRGTFTATVPSATPFVAMLFVHSDPFFVLDSVQQFRALPTGEVEVRAMATSGPCHHAAPPGLPFTVCMHCNNPLPAHAHFVWTQSWYVDLRCDFECDAGYGRDGGGCEAPSASALPSLAPYAACFAVVLLLAGCLWWRWRASTADPDDEESESEPLLDAPARTDAITFKEGCITPHHIRIKIS
jgi:hypothetical protein